MLDGLYMTTILCVFNTLNTSYKEYSSLRVSPYYVRVRPVVVGEISSGSVPRGNVWAERIGS